jgi:hypothetical protein
MSSIIESKTESKTESKSESTESKTESKSESTESTESKTESKSESTESKYTSINITDSISNKLVTDILTLVSNNDEFTKLALGHNFKIGSTVMQNMLDIIKTLSPESLNNIINELNKIFADGKLEPHEVPKLISVMINVLNISKIKKIEHINIGYLIKCLLITLVHFSVIKLNNINLIFTIIDETLGLLDIPIKFSKKCCLFF